MFSASPPPATVHGPVHPESSPFTLFSRPNCQRKSDSQVTGCLTQAENPGEIADEFLESVARPLWKAPAITFFST